MRTTAVAMRLRILLNGRGWTQGDLALVLGRPRKMVNELCGGRRGVTVRTAKELAAAFDIPAIDWLMAQSQERLAALRHTDTPTHRTPSGEDGR